MADGTTWASVSVRAELLLGSFVGQMSAEEARKAFTGFARITRLRDDGMALPVAGETMVGVYALRRQPHPVLLDARTASVAAAVDF